MSNNLSILVLGAGELGLEVLRGLFEKVSSIQQAVTTSVLLRQSTITSIDPDKQKIKALIETFGVTIVAGDLNEESSPQLASLFGNYHTVVSCTGFVGGPGTQLKLVKAAFDGGVKRFFPWQFGIDYDIIGRGSAQNLFDEQLDVRDFLRAQDRMEWVIVSTGMFTSFLFEPWFGVVDLKENIVRALGSWDNTVTVTTARDIGRLTAEIIFTEPRIVNQVVYVAGDTITYKQLADSIDKVLDRQVTRSDEWTVPYLKSELAKSPNDTLLKYRVVFAEERGTAWDKELTFNAQKNIAVTGLEQWIRENLTVVQLQQAVL